MINLIHGDCIDVMRDMDDDSVDLVFCSPPYEDARTYGIDFKLKGQDWVDWAVERFTECTRVSRGLVAWVVEGKTRQFRYSCAPVLMMADLHRAGVHLRKPPVFHRVGIPGSGGPDWLRNDWEFIVCGTSGGKLPWSDNTAMGHPPKWAPGGDMSHRLRDGTRRKGIATRGSKNGDVQTLAEYTPPKKANPGNVINCKVGGGIMGNKLCHENEAPFPEDLAEFFIKSFCPPGGTVLDPFCGSGTTCDVAERLGRNSIGIDVRESQVELSKRRCANMRE
jgi:site-specific DNA-methyltransferase (cytosine-N4-specific)